MEEKLFVDTLKELALVADHRIVGAFAALHARVKALEEKHAAAETAKDSPNPETPAAPGSPATQS